MASKKPSRRDVLKTISASGMALGGGAGITSASPSSDHHELSELEVVELSGKERKSALREIWKDDEFKLLLKEFKKRGLKHNRKDADVSRVTEPNGESRYIATFPFVEGGRGTRRGRDATASSVSDSDEEAFIIYTGVDSLSDEYLDTSELNNVEAHRISTQSADQSVSANSGESETVHITTTNAENGEIVTSSNTFQKSELFGGNQVSTQGHSCDTCWIEEKQCRNINYTCWATHITAGIGIIAGCYACAQTAGFATLACTGCAAGVANEALVSCSLGTDCYSTYTCAPQYPTEDMQESWCG